MLPLEGRLLGGKLRLDRCVGDGGMASVWQATNTLVGKQVAIKLMHARYAGDAELLSRFRNEASAAGRIGSPYICDVLDFGESEIGPYIVMELLEGCSLAELIHAHRRLDPGLAVWILRQALDGLEAAHRAGIIHRDLKPENIYLCRAMRGQWVVKLMDFGISKFANHDQTAAGTTMGTPHYMAPEQIQRAATVDARADLWSIGVILYESITGVQAFARPSVAEALAALRTHDPPPLQQVVPDAPRGLSEVVTRCLQRDPARRWPSAQALAQALARFERPGQRVGAEAEAARRAADTLRNGPKAQAERRTGAQQAVGAVKRTGPQPVVAARGTGPQAAVAGRGTGPQAAVARRTGPLAQAGGKSGPVPSASKGAPVPSASKAVPIAPVMPMPVSLASKRTGAQRPVPSASEAGPVPTASKAGPVPAASKRPGPARTGAQAAVVRGRAGSLGWLWGLLLALLGGGLVALALWQRG